MLSIFAKWNWWYLAVPLTVIIIPALLGYYYKRQWSGTTLFRNRRGFGVTLSLGCAVLAAFLIAFESQPKIEFSNSILGPIGAIVATLLICAVLSFVAGLNFFLGVFMKKRRKRRKNTKKRSHKEEITVTDIIKTLPPIVIPRDGDVLN